MASRISIVIAALALAAGTFAGAMYLSGSQPTAPPTSTALLPVHRSLLAEAARAELDAGGLLVELGTADAHKYTRGGWRTGWGETRSHNSVQARAVTDTKATLTVMLRERPAAVAVRVRSSIAGQRLSLRANGKVLGRGSVGKEWTIIRGKGASLPASGRVELELKFDKSADDGAADVEWVWLARSGDTAARPAIVPRRGPLNIDGRVRRALLAADARTYSYYLHVPSEGQLAFRYGSDKPVNFKVSVQPAGGTATTVFDETAQSGSWQQATVDLGEFAGQAVRLDMQTIGPVSKTGWAEPEIRAPQPERPRRGTPPKNIVLIVQDTTRADVYEPFEPGNTVITPALDAFANKSTSFVNAYNNENWTIPSTATILSGLYPASHSAQFAGTAVPNSVTLISEHLQRSGFHTTAIVANTVLRDAFGFNQGWTEFYNIPRTRSERDWGHPYDEAADWIAKHRSGSKKRFFLWVQSMDTHTDYDPPKAKRELYFKGRYKGKIGSKFSKYDQKKLMEGDLTLTETDRKWIRALYNGEVSHQDDKLTQFLRRLDKLGALKDTLVVVTNDHGEEFGEHETWGHVFSLYEELVRAPLVIHYPPMFPAGLRVNEVVEQVDLTPTLLDALGVPPIREAEGQSLLPLVTNTPTRQRPFYALLDFRNDRRAVRVGRWKLFINTRDGSEELYDLERDPREQRNLAGKRPIALRAAQVYMGEALAVRNKAQRLQGISAPRKIQRVEAQMDEATRKELEALGYLGGAVDNL